MPSVESAKPRVFCLYPVEASVVARGKEVFDFVPCEDTRSKRWREEAEAIMVRGETITSDDLMRFNPGLRFIGKHGVGLDRLDIPSLSKRGVKVMNTPGAGGVAELALALIMTLARDIPAIDRRVRSGEVVSKSEEGARGFLLAGRSIGIVGGGNIGYQLGRMLYAAFDATICLYDPHLSNDAVQRWAGLLPSTRFRRFDNLDEMLPHLDVLSVHVPLLDSTRDMIGEKQLRLMQSRSLLINTARGGIVNEVALLKALDERWISGAGIDAYAVEPPTLENYSGLIAHDRVISLPHIGAGPPDVIRLTALSVIDHLRDAFDGAPRDVVTPP